MPDCSCTPLPPESCSPTNPPPNECGNIRMFFGYTPASGVSVPGQLDRLFYTPNITTDSIKNGFRISDYSCKVLKDSNIINFDTFTLTETELLSASTFESWMIFCSSYVTISGVGFGSPDAPFGLKVLESLGVDFNAFKNKALKMFVSLKSGDTTGFYSILHNLIFINEHIFNNLQNTECDALKENLKIEKLKICYEWFKNIHDTYYGREFLVRVASPRSENESVFPGVCIKDEDGNDPTFNLGNNKAFYIEGDGSSQGFYTSDEIADGGFVKKDSTDILGLTKIDWVQNSDGKIGSFAKVGRISSSASADCPELQNRYIYKKFENVILSDTDSDNPTYRCADWNIDLSKLDINNYYIDDDTLYIKCDIENKFYVDSNGTWIKATLAERIPLSSLDTNTMLAIINFSYLLNKSTEAKKTLSDYIKRYTLNNNVLDGARGNSSQLNLARSEAPCLIPQGFTIPFKSNTYRYGPYFYCTDPDEGGGAEVVIQDNLAPWNFIQSNDNSFPSSYPYCAMDNFGKKLAKLAPVALQNLEKGRVTAVGLPCYNLGISLGVAPGAPNDKGVPPTILTDMSVDYGSGGFSTTYNFSTYSPRLGKSEKYLVDAWSDNIKNTQYINTYLRNEKAKVDNIKKDYTKKLIEKNYYFTPLPKHKSSTPHRIVLSGYYINKTNLDVEALTTYPSPKLNGPEDTLCEPSPSTTPTFSILGSPAPEYTSEAKASGLVRRYSFAEANEGYSVEYIQNTYFQLAGMSMDGFYLPVSLKGAGNDPKNTKEYIINKESGNVSKNSSWENKARLPRFSMRCNFNGEFVEWDAIESNIDFDNKSSAGYPIPTKTRDEIPPFQLRTGSEEDEVLNCYLLPIHQRYLNPYVTNNILASPHDGSAPWDSRRNASTKGFVISSIVFGDDHTNYQISHTDIDDPGVGVGGGQSLNSNQTDEFVRQQIDNFRVPALRGPIVLQGWGYDTTGKPIPNSADSRIHTEYGQFKKDQLTDKFLKNWLENPRTWPVGPVDLRFDRERGVWTCASPNKIIVARLKEDLKCGGSAKAQLLNPEADGINFYHKYHISGPNGENINLNMDKTEIMVYDFLGEDIEVCSRVYVYYDDNRYIVLRSDRSENSIIRFRAIKICEEDEEDPSEFYQENTWGSYAGYGDKYYNYHTYGVAIDCDGNPVDKNGNKTEQEITEDFLINNAKDWLFKLHDSAGKFGPSFAKFKTYEQWKTEAATGYAVREYSKTKSCKDPETSASPAPSNTPECSLGETSTSCISKLSQDVEDNLKKYNILFIESYARFLHGCLTQDLYVSANKANAKYSDDIYKVNHPSGNAAVLSSGIIFYGDAPNGKEPIFLNDSYDSLPLRVFDPWLDKNLQPISCYNPKDSMFYGATSGTPFTAIFNEKEKKYYLWQINQKPKNIIRFKAIKFCSDTTEAVEDAYDEDWGKYAGYGDKFSNYHLYGIRIDCDGKPIDKNGVINENITANFLKQNAEDWLIRLNDESGKFGPSYAIFTNYQTWDAKAATGYATFINDKSTNLSSSPSSACSLGDSNDCVVDNHDDLEVYSILFIESYARFLHGCLNQDLYVSNEEQPYSNDSFKTSHPSGNASVTVTHFYGDAPNGKEPIFLDEDLAELDIRVFDPWLINNDPISCYNPEDSIFYGATSGTPFTAIFNEKEKKYYLWQINQKPKKNIIRFKLIDFCDSVSNPPNYGDDWTAFAGYNDKYPNTHSLGVRINCDGVPVDIDGRVLIKEDLFCWYSYPGHPADNNKAKKIFINILDTVGRHGPAEIFRWNPDTVDPVLVNTDQKFDQWQTNGATGFAAMCDIKTSESCSLGEINECIEDLVVNNSSLRVSEYESYEILFLDSYGRFIECELQQDLYVKEDYDDEYNDDEYKTNNLNGNASAEIINDFDIYGDSPNGLPPKFYDSDLELLPFRVFDPFKDVAKNKNPFRNLKYGDKVLVIFNENLKKYIIWQSIKTHQDSIVKFALVTDKNYNDVTSTAVLVDEYGRPVDEDGVLLTEDNFAANHITVRDPFYSRSVLAPVPNDGTINGDLSAFGPALGSNIFQEHYDGIPLQNRTDSYVNIGPFIGFAMKRKISSDNSSTPPPTLDNEEYIYEIFQLEHYAKYVTGKICSKAAVFAGGYYLGSKRPNGYREGINPIARDTQDLPSGDLILAHDLLQFIGVHSYIIGSGGEYGYSDTDGCSFIALLDSKTSTCDNLIYNIIEAERVALAGQITLKTQSSADSLNNNDFTVSPDGTDMSSTWIQGFMWNQNNENFQDIKIFNRTDHVNRGLYIKNSAVGLILTGMDGDNNLVYGVTDGGTIARTVQRSVSNTQPGLFGTNLIPNIDRKINNTDGFMEGLDPSNLNINDKPIIALKNNKPWMTYYESIVTGAWDETIGGNVSACEYKIIYAREAPVIITGKVKDDLLPTNEDSEIILDSDPLYPSCPGVDKTPIPLLLENLRNPMGFGAKAGDYITVQRVFTNGAAPVAGGISNYYYLIINSGHPPGTLKE